MGKKKVIGYCHICGKFGELSKEHVPPKKAFNNHKYYYALLKDDDPFGEPIRKAYRQGGIKLHTLCESCNKLTGSWYAKAYVDWCFIGVSILKLANGKPRLFYFNKIFPLRVIKQVITMMFSVNSHDFRKSNQELVRFVLNKEENHLPDGYQVYGYFNIEGNPRYNGYAAIGDLKKPGKISQLSEIAYPPFGFVLTMNNSSPPNNKLTNISFFADFQYSTEWEIDLFFNTLPTWYGLPGDYREKAEIEKALEQYKNSKKENI